MDVQKLREEFPITKNYSFMNHAGVSPLPTRSVAAMQEYLQQQTGSSYIKADYARRVSETRQLAADLIGAKPDEIAFTSSTTAGIALVANGLKWNAGDNIVTTAVEFPSNMYPWMNLQSRGVQIRTVLEENGAIPIENIIDVIDSHTRVVTVSAVQYASGFRINLKELGQWCQKRGVLFCVDAIQALGVLPINVEEMHIDFLATAGHKWLCGPEGTGFFYCHREVTGFLNPSIVGWRSVKGGENFGHYTLDFHDDARRFESSAFNMAGIYGLWASMGLIAEVGVWRIQQHVMELTDRLVKGVREKGYRVVSPRTEGAASGIVCFTSHKHDLNQLQKHLETEHRIILVVRQGRLRASPHLYNSPEEIDRLIEVLPKH